MRLLENQDEHQLIRLFTGDADERAINPTARRQVGLVMFIVPDRISQF